MRAGACSLAGSQHPPATCSTCCHTQPPAMALSRRRTPFTPYRQAAAAGAGRVLAAAGAATGEPAATPGGLGGGAELQSPVDLPTFLWVGQGALLPAARGRSCVGGVPHWQVRGGAPPAAGRPACDSCRPWESRVPLPCPWPPRPAAGLAAACFAKFAPPSNSLCPRACLQAAQAWEAGPRARGANPGGASRDEAGQAGHRAAAVSCAAALPAGTQLHICQPCTARQWCVSKHESCRQLPLCSKTILCSCACNQPLQSAGAGVV